MATTGKIDRPGVSPEMLAEAGVRDVGASEAHTLAGYKSPGLILPYRTIAGEPVLIDGKPFCRLRPHTPTGNAKYLSPAGSGCQLYIPPRLRALLLPGCPLGIVEGEFKALALVEAGFPCVGIGGVSSACPRDGSGKPQLLPALAALIAEVRPSRIEFIGDADTALIADFSREAVKLANLVSVPMVLPRIPLDAPGKGIDDLRAIWGAEFPNRWHEIRNTAEPVTADIKPATLAVRLLQREASAFARLDGAARDTACGRLVKLGVACRDDALALGDLTTFAKKYAALTKGVFTSAVRDEAKSQAVKAAVAYAAAREKQAADHLTKDPLYFDGQDYWRREKDGNYGRLSRLDTLLHFGVAGLYLNRSFGEPSPAERALHHLQGEARVVYAGPICGRQPGLITENGRRILVTRGLNFIEGVTGDAPTISALVANLLGRAASDRLAEIQAAVFFAWFKLGRLALRNPHDHRPGQVIAFVGPKDCGKSFLQEAVITPGLGGRVADPTLWLTGRTPFNGDLWAAEHLAIGDKGLGENGIERKRMRDELKLLVAASEYALHAKYCEQLTLRHIWRLSISVNDDPESASSLPALDASFADKIIYLQCHLPPIPFFDADDPRGRQIFRDRISTELPAFLDAVDNFKIPGELQKGRFGVCEFHHPNVLGLIQNNSPLVPLGEVLESWFEKWEPNREWKEYPTVKLYEELDQHLKNGLGAISSGPHHLGHQLARLSELESWRGRIIRKTHRIGGHVRNQQQTLWHIRPDAAAG